MRTVRLFLSILTLISGTFLSPAQEQDFTLEEIFLSDKFTPQRMNGIQWLNDGEHYTFIRNDPESGVQQILAHSAKDGSEQLLLDGSMLVLPGTDEPLRFDSCSWSPDESRLLLAANTKQIWRYSRSADYYLFDRSERWLRPISPTPGEVMNVKFSPDGKYIGFVRDDDIYYYNIETQTETRLTDTAGDRVYNGRFGWVYEEEFGIADGWRWSPDSKRVAYWHEDENPVNLFILTDYMPLYSEQTVLPYPKAGDDNPVVQIGVVDIETGKTIWMDIGAETDQYIPRIAWTEDPSKLSVQKLNRAQNHLEFLIADVTTGSTEIIFEERSPGWIDITDDLTFLDDGTHFLWISNRDGWNHFYLYDYTGRVVRQITEGPWDVSEITAVDGNRGVLFYTSSEITPRENHLFRIGLDGGNKTRLTREPGLHMINMSPTGDYYIDTYSNTNTPLQVHLFDRDGREIRRIISNSPEPYEDYRISRPKFGSFTTSDSFLLDYRITFPADFDTSNRYPVIFSVYGGPGSQRVRDTWINLWEQHLAQKGFIIFTMDPRGTGGRGRDFLFASYKRLGVTEVNDFIEGAKYLAGYDYVDPSRNGIWGWSYGGYVSILTLLLGADYFKTGVSVAPVTDWRFYDTIYTERYMLRPQDNPEGYDAGSCIVHADSLRGNLLIVHGAMDDNVHLQNTYHFIDALQRKNKRFDLHKYPRGNHGIGSGIIRLHYHTLFTNFFLEKL
jgi:dipeptidyl-peptidase 4